MVDEDELTRQRALFDHARERPVWPDGRVERCLERLRPRQYVALRYNEAAGYRCVLAHNNWTLGREAIPWGDGHAGRLETALILGLHPELVDTAELPGAETPLVGAAESRTHPEHGPVTQALAQKVVETAVERMAAFVSEGLSALPADTRPPHSARGL